MNSVFKSLEKAKFKRIYWVQLLVLQSACKWDTEICVENLTYLFINRMVSYIFSFTSEIGQTIIKINLFT